MFKARRKNLGRKRPDMHQTVSLATFAITDTILAMRPFAAVVALILIVCPAFARTADSGDAAYEKLAADAIDASSLAWRPLTTNAGLHDYDTAACRITAKWPSPPALSTAACWKCRKLGPASASPHNAYDRQIILAGLHRDMFWRREASAPTSTIRWRIPQIVAVHSAELRDSGRTVEVGDRAMNAVPAWWRMPHDPTRTWRRQKRRSAMRSAAGVPGNGRRSRACARATRPLKACFRDLTKLAAAIRN